jgi:DNA-binding MarR family transcriptional regulator
LLLELESLTSGKSEDSDAPTIGHMARNVNLSQNTVSEKITRLEKKGLVSRQKDEKDRRISRIYLTASGKSLLNEIEQDASKRFLEEALSELPIEDLDTLSHLMGRLIHSMSSV